MRQISRVWAATDAHKYALVFRCEPCDTMKWMDE